MTTGIYNTLFIQYTDEGNVVSITNTPDNSFRFFEIDLNLVTDFLFGGTKDPKKYKIDYFFNLSKGVVVDDVEQEVTKNNLPYLLPRTNAFNNEITLVHDSKNSQWSVYIRDDVKDKLNVISDMSFFVVKKDDPCFFYRFFSVPRKELILSKIDIPFLYDEETDISNISVITEKRFNSYGIKEA